MLDHEQGTDGRTYGGDRRLIHIPDGTRRDVGRILADKMDSTMRLRAIERNASERLTQPLCPGCYMVAGFNMMTELARRSGQDMRELGRSMAGAFQRLAEDGDDAASIEEIEVVFDPEEEPAHV